MAKTNARKDTPANLFNVFVTSYAEASATYDAKAAIAAAGGAQDTVKRDYMAGKLARILLPLQAPTPEVQARMHKVLANAGFGGTAKLKEGQGRRTKAEQDAYNSAKMAWSRAIAKAGVKTKDKRGGARKRKEEAKAPEVAPIVPAPANAPALAIPAAKTHVDCVTFAHQQAAMLLAFANKNAKAMPIPLRNAIGAFMAAVKAVEAEEAKESEAA